MTRREGERTCDVFVILPQPMRSVPVDWAGLDFFLVPLMFGSKPPFQRGFSLIEVMMATTILLVGFIGLIQAVTIGSDFLDTARKLEVANQIVTTEIEKLRSGDWATIANLPATATITINSSGVISGDATRFALASYTAAT